VIPHSNDRREDDLQSAGLFYRQVGANGPRVVLLHAIGLDHRSWAGVLPYLDGYRCVTPDLPGHGESDKPLTADYSLPSMGARMVRLLDELGWDDAIFVGNSIGGGTSLATTLYAPERVRALVLVNTVGFRRGLPPVGRLAFAPVAPWISAYTPILFVRLGLDFARCRWGGTSLELGVRCRTYFGHRAGRGAFFRMLRQLYGPALDRMSAEYSRIACPTLVMHGVRDPLIRLRHAEQLAREIPGAKLFPLPGLGHFPQEEEPEQVALPLRRFLDRLGAKE
jgi:pimeloyl-ACP methyl ester carboxylesterase